MSCTREEWLLVWTGPAAQGTEGPGSLGLTFVFRKVSATQVLQKRDSSGNGSSRGWAEAGPACVSSRRTSVHLASWRRGLQSRGASGDGNFASMWGPGVRGGETLAVRRRGRVRGRDGEAGLRDTEPLGLLRKHPPRGKDVFPLGDVWGLLYIRSLAQQPQSLPSWGLPPTLHGGWSA